MKNVMCLLNIWPSEYNITLCYIMVIMHIILLNLTTHLLICSFYNNFYFTCNFSYNLTGCRSYTNFTMYIEISCGFIMLFTLPNFPFTEITAGYPHIESKKNLQRNTAPGFRAILIKCSRSVGHVLLKISLRRLEIFLFSDSNAHLMYNTKQEK